MATRIKENQIRRELYRKNTTLSKNVRLLRLLHGYSQQDMADALHISRTTYFGLEYGGKTPDFKAACELADFYNINLDYLISYDITEQLLSLLQVDQKDTNALNFITKYLSLSYSGRDQMKTAIEELKKCEDTYRTFPWKYETVSFERK